MELAEELKLHDRLARESSQKEWTKGIIGYFYQMYAKKSQDFLEHNNLGFGLVLDVGCGEGYIFKDYHQQHKIVQIDASLTVLGSAVSFNSKIVCANAMELPFKDKIFDLIFLIAILEHTSGPEKLVREVSRVAKGKTKVFIVIPNDISLSLGRLLLLKFPIRNPGHLTFFTPGKLRRMIRNEFNILEEYSMPFRFLNFFFNMYHLMVLEKR